MSTKEKILKKDIKFSYVFWKDIKLILKNFILGFT
jgi:hypothetical protein